jgi:prepilin-type N-terminal cleavage/methylation domain-containing protein/prepilin-type processing-associated H-X9-DG protein
MMRLRATSRGFTLVELLVAVGVIVLLLALLLPAMAGARRAAQKAECVGNLRRLTQAWEQYHAMNHGQLVCLGSNGRVNEEGLSVAWVADGPDEEGIRKGGLWPYTQTTRAYHCPADTGFRQRSYSGNAFLSGDFASWDTGKLGERAEKLISLRKANGTFVFTEEALAAPAPWQVVEAFFVPPTGDIWEHYPAAFHRDGVNVSFVDGHCEFYKFDDPRTAKITARKTSTPNSPDLKQFQEWIGVSLSKYRAAGSAR